MRIKKLKEEFPWTTEQTESRSPGLHLSDIIHDMDKTLMLTNSYGWDKDEVRDHRNLNFEKGYLWEVALSRAFGEKAAHRPGEIELDGVLMSPDGTKYIESGEFTEKECPIEELLLEEYKCTALSSEKSPADNWKWMMQVKGYCKALGATKCIFRILYHVDIMRHPGSAYGVFLLTFTQGELDENWEAVLNHKRVMEERDGS